MNELTNTGLSAISKTHEQTMRALFNLTVRPPKKIEIDHQHGEGVDELVVTKEDGKTKLVWIPF